MIDVTPEDPLAECRAGKCPHIQVTKCPYCDVKRWPGVQFEFSHGLLPCGCGYRVTPQLKPVKPKKSDD